MAESGKRSKTKSPIWKLKIVDEVEEDKVYYEDDLTGAELDQALNWKPDDPP